MRLADLVTGSNGGLSAIGAPGLYAQFSPTPGKAFYTAPPIRAGWPMQSVGDVSRMPARAISIRKMQLR